MSQPVLKVEGLTKRFGSFVAVDHVDFEVGHNEVHALIGENGAGKSTLCKMLTGVYPISEGKIYLDGQEVHFKSAADSIAAGIGMVYQERNLVPFMTGAQNISLGNEMTKLTLVDEKSIIQKAEDIRTQLGVAVPLGVEVEEMGAGEKQLIEIMRAFFITPKILILDEPTASLGEGEIEPFLKFITDLKQRIDISVIYITHKLDEIFTIADKVTVLADGATSLSANIKDVTKDECVRAMMRSDKIKRIEVPQKDTDALKRCFELDTLEFEGKKHSVKMHTCYGEVVGCYGLVGSGRTETMEVCFGTRAATKREFLFDGEKITNESSIEMIRKGMALTPELRRNGIFKSLSLVSNICNLFIRQFTTKAGFSNHSGESAFTKNVLEKNFVKYRSTSQSISELSGGNIQKVLIGRAVEIDPLKLLIADEPTVGMDLGAKSEIYLKLRKLADEDDKSVIFISSELEELLSVCDRLYVFYEGNVVGSLKRADFDKETVLSMALRGMEASL